MQGGNRHWDADGVAAHLRDYDWDGLIAASAAELAALLEGHHDEIARTFWDHYLALPAASSICAPNTDRPMARSGWRWRSSTPG